MADEFRRNDDEPRLPAPPESEAGHGLPWPEETDPRGLGERFAHGPDRDERGLGRSFVRTNQGDERELGREFADPDYADHQRLAASFADPNSADDGRLGESFVQSNSSRKRRKPPIAERVHKPANRRALWIGVIVFLVVVALVYVIALLMRHPEKEQAQQHAQQQRNAEPVVDTEQVQRPTRQAGLVLPGTTIPLTQAFVYARANGYLRRRLVDIGDHVHKGQLLAVIDAPDLDAQVLQAKQQLQQAVQQQENQQSQLALATVTVNRYRVLVAKGVLSRQDGDQQEATYGSQLANVAAAKRNVDAFQANLQRVQALQSYEDVRAPFDGVVTQRNVDVGALISAAGANSGMQQGPAPQGQSSTAGGTQQASQSNNAGASGMTNSAATSAQSPGQGGPLFGISQTRRLRILVSVPEGYASSMHAGGHAELAFEEFPGTPFQAEVTRTADSVDANTRTMLVELQVDNTAGKLFSGMYTVATFPATPGLQGPLLINGDAIAIRQDTTAVATVQNGKVHFVPVVIGRDLGGDVEITSGLQQGETIVTNVTDDVTEGAPVKIHMRPNSINQPTAPEQKRVPLGGDSRYGNPGITEQNVMGKQAQQTQKGEGKSGGNSKRQAGSQSKP